MNKYGKRKRTVFYVRKDISKPFEEGNWIKMLGPQFYEFMETEEFNKCPRYFTRIAPCTKGEDTLVMECSRDKCLKMESERAKARYSHELMEKTGIVILSLEMLIALEDDEAEDSESDRTRYIIDPASDVVDIILARERDRKVHEEIARLSAGQKEIIDRMFFDGDLIGTRECARKLDKSYSTVKDQKERAYTLLKEALRDWRCD